MRGWGVRADSTSLHGMDKEQGLLRHTVSQGSAPVRQLFHYPTGTTEGHTRTCSGEGSSPSVAPPTVTTRDQLIWAVVQSC